MPDAFGDELVDRLAGRGCPPEVLRGWAPVRKAAQDRAWSPAPSPLARALS